MNFIRWAAALGAAVCALPAFGQATAATLTYSSAFAGYRPYQDLELADWRLVNDTVRDAAANGAASAAQTPSARQSSGSGTSATSAPAAATRDAPAPTNHLRDHSGHGAKR